MDHLGQVFKRHFYLLLSRTKSKNPVYLMCEGVQSADQYCNDIIDRRSTFGSLNWPWLLTKTMAIGKQHEELQVRLGTGVLEQVTRFVYLGGLITEDGRCEEDVKRRIG